MREEIPTSHARRPPPPRNYTTLKRRQQRVRKVMGSTRVARCTDGRKTRPRVEKRRKEHELRETRPGIRLAPAHYVIITRAGCKQAKCGAQPFRAQARHEAALRNLAKRPRLRFQRANQRSGVGEKSDVWYRLDTARVPSSPTSQTACWG